MVPTSIYGNHDLTVTNWFIFESGTGRHIFGMCFETGQFQLSSAILEETDEYVRTKSRKYFKDGPANQDRQDKPAMITLREFLKFGWRRPDEEISRLIQKHSDCIIFGDKIIYDPEVE